jgi:outer membrane lipoprotein carrier protein
MLLVILAAFASAGLCHAADAAQTLARKIESRYKSAQTLGATFLERYSEGRQTAEVESGHVFFSRPGRMRWEYEAPEKKLFLSDGKFVWFYVPSDRTVTRARVKSSTDWRTPLALLTGKANLSRLCGRIEILPHNIHGPPEHAVLRCIPRGEGHPGGAKGLSAGESPEGDFLEVLLEVDRTNGDLASVLVRQPGGVELEYRFANWTFNPPLEESLFHFATPVGVAIVEAPPESDGGGPRTR